MSYRIGPPPPPWKAELVLDFFFSAAGAGTLTVASAYGLVRGPSQMANAAFIAAPCIAASLLVLVHDLGKPSRFWRMVATLNPRSAMSWGAFILNGCFAVAGLAFLLRFFGWGNLFAWRAIAFVGLVLGPATLAYKGVLLSTTAVPLWRRGRLFGPLLLADGVALGAAILALFPDGHDQPVVAAMHSAALFRGLVMAFVLWRSAEDRSLLLRSWIAPAWFVALGLSPLVSYLPILPAALGTIAASLLLRAALLRAPYTRERLEGRLPEAGEIG